MPPKNDPSEVKYGMDQYMLWIVIYVNNIYVLMNEWINVNNLMMNEWMNFLFLWW